MKRFANTTRSVRGEYNFACIRLDHAPHALGENGENGRTARFQRHAYFIVYHTMDVEARQVSEYLLLKVKGSRRHSTFVSVGVVDVGEAASSMQKAIIILAEQLNLFLLLPG